MMRTLLVSELTNENIATCGLIQYLLQMSSTISTFECFVTENATSYFFHCLLGAIQTPRDLCPLWRSRRWNLRSICSSPPGFLLPRLQSSTRTQCWSSWGRRFLLRSARSSTKKRFWPQPGSVTYVGWWLILPEQAQHVLVTKSKREKGAATLSSIQPTQVYTQCSVNDPGIYIFPAASKSEVSFKKNQAARFKPRSFHDKPSTTSVGSTPDHTKMCHFFNCLQLTFENLSEPVLQPLTSINCLT